ncbi:hypothetical protein E4P29_04600 [Rhodococcus sp. 1R11]|uniref:TRADD-N-associated membrane domain-containing protein n=1 Tax=Rhodococcus sp. 1R11 TaxID=2559614 RepID=UPI001072E1FB|nr:hypothetical protein [Rhodococcus sp. 1R11]TFI45022.1 hypothetical protein E4P29_04600 [Rhodococcus sp. 1R11]
MVTGAIGVGTAVASTYVLALQSKRQQKENEAAVADLRLSQRRSSVEATGAESKIPDEFVAERAQVAALNRRADLRFDIQIKTYADALQQNTTYFYLSLGVGIVGLLLIAIAGVVAVLGLAGYATVAAVAGFLTESAAALVFNQSHRARKAAQDNLESLAAATEAAEDRALSLIYSARVQDPDRRDELNARLALEALRPSSGGGGMQQPRAVRAGGESTERQPDLVQSG